MTDETGTMAYAYDGLDRATTATHSITGTVTYGWDMGGRRTSVAASGTNAPTITYLYDDAGRPTFVQRNGSLLAEATYDTAGRLATVERTNPGLVAGATTTFAYDAADPWPG
jgi:YD repeat-containing protein